MPKYCNVAVLKQKAIMMNVNSTRQPDAGQCDGGPRATALIPASILSAPGEGKSQVFLRRAAVCRRTGLPASTLYRYVAQGLFPRPYRLGPNTVAWLATDVDSWCATRPQNGGRRHG